ALAAQTDEFDLRAGKLAHEVAGRTELDRAATELRHQRLEHLEAWRTIFDTQHALLSDRTAVRVDVQQSVAVADLLDVFGNRSQMFTDAECRRVPFGAQAHRRIAVDAAHLAVCRERQRVTA